MPRARHGATARPSRNQGVISGTTFEVSPSGVTIDYNGINVGGTVISQSELGYLTGLTGYPIESESTSALKWTHGVVDSVSWSVGASNILSFNTGNTILALFFSVRGAGASGVSQISWMGSGSTDTGGVTVTLLGSVTASTNSVLQSGTSLWWASMGT